MNAIDPKDWLRQTAESVVLGLDIGMAQDLSALVAAGAWRSGGRSVIGVFDTVQFPLQTPLDEVADFVADATRRIGARVVFDASNNSAFASILAARMGANPANSLIAAAITNAADHANQPVQLMLSLGGLRTAIPKWTLSKREMIESVSAEIDGGTLKIGKAGDWETLRTELSAMERTVRQSGSIAYSAPAGKHDDMVIALALAAFGLRRAGRTANRRRRSPARINDSAWT